MGLTTVGACFLLSPSPPKEILVTTVGNGSKACFILSPCPPKDILVSSLDITRPPRRWLNM